MGGFNVLEDVAERTGGSVYIGVVGPVRTGKSTFIKRFMDLLVLPNIEDTYDKQRARDELPQSGAGRTVMTTQPRFVPDDPVEITIHDSIHVKARLVDCVGYAVSSARGYEEDGQPRMVRTPWSDGEVPFHEAAELGTRKVITDHSTVGVVVTTDGSVTDIPRGDYVTAEEQVVSELAALGKPFVVFVNSSHPETPETQSLVEELTAKYGVSVVAGNALNMAQEEVLDLLERLLLEFPVREISFQLPSWVEVLGREHELRAAFEDAVGEAVTAIDRVRDVQAAVEQLAACEVVSKAELDRMELGSGSVLIRLETQPNRFYEVMSDVTGLEMSDERQLLRLLMELADAKRSYDKVSSAIESVRALGYGVVIPNMEEISFDDPELIRQGSRFGVRLKASAPSIHMVRADINTEVTPFVGTEKQSEEFVTYLTEEFEKDPAKVWNSDFLGRPLQDLVREGIQEKLYRLPDHAQDKLQETLTKIVNEGSGGLICIIL